MKDALAERLIASVMEWKADEMASQRPLLQAIASFKYDDYQQFSPGMRFIESFALWLDQFRSAEERKVAYELVTKRLIFVSSDELAHLISIAYPDHIRPLLLRRVASETAKNERSIGSVARSNAFRIRQRQCLFLGLSDGAHTDMFRRHNPELSHEQVRQSYELTEGRVDNLLESLRKDLTNIIGSPPSDDMVRFRTIVLLDDLSASGVSYLRREDDRFEGKIAKFYENISVVQSRASHLVDKSDLEVLIVLYIGTEQAKLHLEAAANAMWGNDSVQHSIMMVYQLRPQIRITAGLDTAIDALINAHYDESIENEHTKKGGGSSKYGFAQCGLPLVLSHNTPNNTIPIIWAKTPKLQPLFPRVSRF